MHPPLERPRGAALRTDGVPVGQVKNKTFTRTGELGNHMSVGRSKTEGQTPPPTRVGEASIRGPIAHISRRRIPTEGGRADHISRNRYLHRCTQCADQLSHLHVMQRTDPQRSRLRARGGQHPQHHKGDRFGPDPSTGESDCESETTSTYEATPSTAVSSWPPEMTDDE